jgi:hypothetical protein
MSAPLPRQLHLFKGNRQRGVAPPPAPEFHTHVMVADLLRRFAEPAWRWWHIPSGEKRTPATGARLKRMGAQRGLPDFELLAPRGAGHGRPHFLELKRKGSKQSAEQIEFAEWCLRNDCPYAMASCFVDAVFVLKQWGVVRTGISV